MAEDRRAAVSDLPRPKRVGLGVSKPTEFYLYPDLRCHEEEGKNGLVPAENLNPAELRFSVEIYVHQTMSTAAKDFNRYAKPGYRYDPLKPPSTSSQEILRLPIAPAEKLCRSCARLEFRRALIESNTSFSIGDARDIDSRSSQCVLCSLSREYLQDVVRGGEYAEWAANPATCTVDLCTANVAWGPGPASRAVLGFHAFLKMSKPGSVRSIGPPKLLIQARQDAVGPLSAAIATTNGNYLTEAMCRTIAKRAKICKQTHTTCDGRTFPCQDDFAFRLIDVRTREVRRAGNKKIYIALSYMWGDYTRSKENLILRRTSTGTETLPHDLPQTVEDVLRVVQLLGVHYVWIDAYCISQTDPAELKCAVSNMDWVYENALLTICPLWADSMAGLHGVSRPFEDGRARALGENYVCSEWFDRHPLDHEIVGTPWHTRAWVFQESVLSRQRLLFKPSSVTLLCYEQTINTHYFTSPPSISDGTSKYILSDIAIRNCLLKNHWNFSAYQLIVRGYTSRHLSFEHDAINAISGILKRTSRESGMEFCEGLPRNDLINGLLWTCEEPVRDESWTNKKFGLQYDFRRRFGFPSWSWAAYDTKAKYSIWINSEQTCLHIVPDQHEDRRHPLGNGNYDINVVEKANITINESSLQRPTSLKIDSQDVIVHLLVGPGRKLHWRADGFPGAVETGGQDTWLTTTLGSFYLDKRFAPNMMVAEDTYRVRLVLLAHLSEAEDDPSQRPPTRSERARAKMSLPILPRGTVGDTILAMAVSEPGDTETVERVGIIAVPVSFWQAAQPERSSWMVV